MHAVPEAVPGLLSKPFSLSKQDSSPSAYKPPGLVTAGKFTDSHRLLREDGFDRVVQAENIADRHLKVFFSRNNKDNARLGIIASKRILPRTVDRNRIKRAIREVFRQHSIKSQNLDIVVMVRQACAQEPGMQVDNLKVLFSRVENRCAEL